MAMSISDNSSDISLDTKKHSFSHIMAAAVLEMFPEAKFGVGPVIENGCFYDFILPRTLIPEDLELIEEKIKEILYRPLLFKRQELGLEEAVVHFRDKGQDLKVELLMDLKEKGTTKMDKEEKEIFDEGEVQVVSLYRLVDNNTGEILFEDLCKGPHVETMTEINGEKNSENKSIGFKLDKFSGSYWRGDQERGIDMQRIYALVFDNDEELGEFLFQRNEAKKRDHRVVGKDMKLFTISNLVGAGLPLMQPRGMVIRKLVEDYLWQIHEKKGYQRVWTPHIAKVDLYETSGHAAKFGDELFRVQGKEDEFILKPMNCPHHMQIYADNQFSYRDLPIRYFEPTTVYRDEKSGQLSGLTRVRSITQDDGHLFCLVDQIEEEVVKIVEAIKEFYATMSMDKEFWVSLSLRGEDHSKYLGEDKIWHQGEQALENVCRDLELPYKKVEGEAAFYGPKLDFVFKDAINREWQLSTIQLDFVLPERFDLSYINESGDKERPVVIHRAISGSLERFLGVMIEHFGGRFPLWLAPVQVKILTVNNKEEVLEYVNKVKLILEDLELNQPLKHNRIRSFVDDRDESLGRKIREAEVEKIPVIVIIGPKDLEDEMVSVRTQNGEQKMRLNQLKEFILNNTSL